MKTAEIKAAHFKQLNARRKSPARLNNLFQIVDSPGANASGVAVTSYGQGQVSGVTYTVRANGERSLKGKRPRCVSIFY